MSGHSKWATIKHKKGAIDKARGKLFAKLARQLEVAARSGGMDVDTSAARPEQLLFQGRRQDNPAASGAGCRSMVQHRRYR